MKRIIVLLAAIVSLFSLTGCNILAALSGAADFDAALYIKGNLESMYLGQFDDDYLDIVDATKEDLEESHLYNVEYEYYEYFSKYFSVATDYISDETNQKGIDLVKEIYSHSRFKVDSSTKAQDGSFNVTVTISPITIIQDFDVKYWDSYLEDFDSKYNYDDPSLTEAELEALIFEGEEFWANRTFDTMTELMNNGVSYGDEVVVVIRVYEDTDGLYTYSDSDFSSIDNLILKYN